MTARMALTVQPPQSWGRWLPQQPDGEYAMVDASGLMQYNSGPTTTAPIQRPAIPPQFMPVVDNAYAMTPIASPPTPQYPPNNHFVFGSYTPPSPPMAPSFKNYQEQCPPPRSIAAADHVRYQRELGQTHPVEEVGNAQIKHEPQVAIQQTPTPPPIASKTITRNVAEDEANEVAFNTEVDILMKAIQLRSEPDKASDFGEAAYPSPPQMDEEKFNLRRKSCSPAEASSASGQNRTDRQKRYVCDIKGCGKRCSQKTQLETHKRAHTGEKPFVCTEPGCGLGFTQRGNLKTHIRRHTGEKPYECDICGKAFAQLGNVKPHRLTHFKSKPFVCIFDRCGKYFGQRGNLKTHHNRSHKEAIKDLTMRFNNLGPDEELPEEDQKLFRHFAELYKNSNKGIKGRGSNRTVNPKHRISDSPNVPHPYAIPQFVQQMYQYRHPQQHGLSCSDSFGDYGMPPNGPSANIMIKRDPHAAYGSYDMDQASITSNDTATISSSPSTVYEDERGHSFAHQRIY
ncbi:hypothetical protein F4677DRAFT_58755 [Hypoxylon crocopeplum]|nr:hypothetical protein F4677DRAFT_58755 [Hypoxylon crocopeplum]